MAMLLPLSAARKAALKAIFLILPPVILKNVKVLINVANALRGVYFMHALAKMEKAQLSPNDVSAVGSVPIHVNQRQPR